MRSAGPRCLAPTAPPGGHRPVRIARIALRRSAAYRIRREKEFKTFAVAGRGAVSLVHISATHPFRAGRHPDLIARPIVPDGRPHSVCAVAVVIARLRVIRATSAAASMNAIMPVKIVIGDGSVPAAVMVLERIVRPSITGVCAAYNDTLTSET